jgi:hypothetical protein
MLVANPLCWICRDAAHLSLNKSTNEINLTIVQVYFWHIKFYWGAGLNQTEIQCIFILTLFFSGCVGKHGCFHTCATNGRCQIRYPINGEYFNYFTMIWHVNHRSLNHNHLAVVSSNPSFDIGILCVRKLRIGSLRRAGILPWNNARSNIWGIPGPPVKLESRHMSVTKYFSSITTLMVWRSHIFFPN